jgi:hypothetical protein
MKKILTIVLLFVALTSFKSTGSQGYPCHPLGDWYVCLHPMHMFDYDVYGNTYPCTHPMHPQGHVLPCVHVCY